MNWKERWVYGTVFFFLACLIGKIGILLGTKVADYVRCGIDIIYSMAFI